MPDDLLSRVRRQFVGEQAPGAFENGTRVRKINTIPGDGHQDGALGTIRGSFGPSLVQLGDVPAGAYAYAVEWDDMPGRIVVTTSTRVEALQ